MASRGLREAVAAAAVVVMIFGLLTLWSGVWPPLVVIESGSMMHQEGCLDPTDRNRDGNRECTPYGRLGTMDPGDIVAVQRITKPSDVRLLVQAGEGTYGYAGDVIMFNPSGNSATTPIIHRAITWIDVIGTGPDRRYEVLWTDGERLHFDSRGIYMPELGFDERWGYPKGSGYKPAHSGFVTRGDNPLTNPTTDQALQISQLVKPEWVVGTAHGEIPWFGLLKLAVAPTLNTKFPPISWVRVGNAFAPADLWIMLGVMVGALLAIPVTIDVVRAWREIKKDRAAERTMQERARQMAEQRAPPPAGPPPEGARRSRGALRRR